MLSDLNFLSFPSAIVKGSDSNYKIENYNKGFSLFCDLSLEDNHTELTIDSLNIPPFEIDPTSKEKLKKAINRVLAGKNVGNLYAIDYSTTINEVWLIKISSIAENPNSALLCFHNISDIFDSLEFINPKNDRGNELEIETSANNNALSEELNNFMYSVSHDLRAPLRRIDGFSQELINEYSEQLDETGRHYLKRVRRGAQDMGDIIDELLKLSRLSQSNVKRERLDLGSMAKQIYKDLAELENERNISFTVEKSLQAKADPGLVKILLTNLISNAIKFSKLKEQASITLGKTSKRGGEVFFLKDNGVGFDQAHSQKLFTAFSRLHTKRNFSGSGIGLATVKRIIDLHNGMIWAKGEVNQGAIFYFTFN